MRTTLQQIQLFSSLTFSFLSHLLNAWRRDSLILIPNQTKRITFPQSGQIHFCLSENSLSFPKNLEYPQRHLIAVTPAHSPSSQLKSTLDFFRSSIVMVTFLLWANRAPVPVYEVNLKTLTTLTLHWRRLAEFREIVQQLVAQVFRLPSKTIIHEGKGAELWNPSNRNRPLMKRISTA